MKTTFTSLALLCLTYTFVFAQSEFFVAAGASIHTTGNSTLTLHNTKLTNNGTLNDANGTLLLTGNATAANSAIAGTGTTTLKNLSINKSSNNAQLKKNIVVNGNLSLTSGGMELFSGNIDLGTTGLLLSETEVNRLFGAGGTIRVTANLNAPSAAKPGNLGAEITSTQNLGSTVIIRGHQQFSQTGNSILRYFDITPSNNTSLNATLRFYYLDAEINGNNEATVALWRSTDNGTTWTEETGTLTRDGVADWIQLLGINAFSRWTLANPGALAPMSTCPTLAATSTTNYSIFSGDNTSDINVSTTVNDLNVKLVYFTTPQATNAARYTGGTMIGSSTAPTGASSPFPLAFNNLSFPINNTASPITYYVYAILDVTDPEYTDNTCQPSVAFEVTVDNNRTTVTGNTFCNTGSITLNDGGTGGQLGTAATPYPSNIFVSGLAGTIQSITVDLKGVVHLKSRDIDLLLVAPTGQQFLMMTGVGDRISDGFTGPTFIPIPSNLTLSDAAVSALPRSISISSGTYRPASYESWANTFPAPASPYIQPAPAGPYSQAAPVGTATFASVFNGLDPNGTWQLFATDDTSGTAGIIADGWCLNFTLSCPNPIAYVNQAVAASGDGTTWGTAFKTLQEALTAANNCPSITQIWVANGTYYPTADATGNLAPTDARTKTFVMKNNLAIYGGFSGNGTETMLSERNWSANPTILSGEIQQDNDASNNSFHVIRNYSTSLTSTAVLDGFTITGGNAPSSWGGGMLNFDSSPSLSNITFSGNSAEFGGGMFNHDSSPSLSNVTFLGNSGSYGGGMFNENASNASLSNVTFSGNSATTFGGGMFNVTSSPSLINVSFSGNTAPNGGGMYNNFSNPAVTNCILWGNSSEIVNVSSSTPIVTYSIVQGGYAGTGNLDGTNPANNPLFVNQPPVGLGTTGDLRLQACSPAIDAGTSTGAPATDILGNARVDAIAGGNIVDMGAYEFQSTLQLQIGITSVTSTPIICQNDGTITAVVSATCQLVGTVTYSINGVGGNTANTTGVFSGLPSGNYTVTVYDSGNITNFAVTTVTVSISNTAPVVTAIATAALCNGGNGTIALTVANGTAPYDYEWDGPGANDGSSPPNVVSYTINPAPPGTYAIKATDALGCETTTSVIVAEPTTKVQGNGMDIADGDAMPSLSDHTDFGTTNIGVGFARMFTIQNTGGAPFSISSITSNNTRFAVSGAPTSVAANNSATFTVTFTPTVPGAQNATITINNDNCVYDFAVTGVGTCPDLIAASPGPAIITNSTCSTGCTLSGGNIAAPSGICPTGSTLQYKVGNGVWTNVLPTYNQTTAQTIKTRCSCDADPSIRSDSSAVTTVPGTCPSATASIVMNNGPICSGNNAVFTVTGTNGSTLTYHTGGGNQSLFLTGSNQQIIVLAVVSNTTLNLVSVATGGSPVCTTLLSDMSTVNVDPLPTVEAGSDRLICASQDTIRLNGSFGGAATGAIWSGGTGTFTPNANTLNAIYTFTAADTAANGVKLYLTTNDPAGPCGPAKDSIIITIDPASIVNAGPDQTICATDTIYLSATLSGVATNLVWQKNAAFGTFIGSDTSPNAKYVLNSTGQALSSIKFGVMSNDPGGNVCQGGLDTVQIFINPAAYVDAGVDTTICASTTSVKLKGSISGAATSATWTTSGTGTFSPNATTLNATYTPSLAYTAAGTVTLTLTTNDPAGALCGPAVDTKIITIDPASIVNAGPDQTICATDTIYLSATLSGVATNLVWQKNVAFGTFVGSDTSPNAKYVLNSTGQALSSIKFGVMSNDPGGNVCQGGLDTVQIFINPAAYVDAGVDTTICASTTSIKLKGSISGAATSATWTTSGTGTFSPNATTLNATYTPSLADTAAGTVTLTLTTNDPAGALCGPAVDTKIITIDPASIVNAGPDQTICASDTIYLSATLSGVADALVWQKNAAFGTFIGSDTSPNAKYVLNATGQQLSSIKFGVMSNDPGGNVCQGGLDTVEIFISDPIDASVSIDQDTVCVGAAFTLTFNESTLPQGSEFTVVIKYTDENGAGSKTLTNVANGDQTIFEEGIDFDGILTVTQIIVTPETAGFCADTLDGFKVEVVVCEATISDPCVCQNNAEIGQNGTNSNTGTFSDKVTINGPINQTWTVASVTGYYENAAGTDPVDVGDVFTQVSPGLYEFVGYHIDAIGYTITVSNGRGLTVETGNKCFYPDPVFTGLPALVAPSAAPFQVTGTVADNVAGTGTFILDGVPQAGASSAPTVLTINPGTLAPGPHTLVYSFDAGAPASNDPLDPGCVQQVRQRFQVANCACQDVTVSLDANCQFLLTGNLVSDVNCGGGTVRVMDNDPSNGGLIDCAGVWTYGLFDAFGNIICWGKVTAEDKTAPVLVCAPADFTLDCYDVNYVLNNRLTIGNVGATSSPRPSSSSPQTINNAEGVAGTGDNCQLGLAPPSLVSDNIKNLGYAYFKDNCYNCGCRITLKWSDKVEFYSCEQMKVNGGYYALISREWTATDCNGMRSSYVQKIKFTRPAVDDFVFNGPGEGKYDRVVEYNSCIPDKSLIKKEDVTPYVCSYFNTSANPRCLFIDQVECNYSVSIKDTEFPICGGKGVKIDRELYVLDWCAGGIVDTFHILIKIGDFEGPTATYAEHAPYEISTGPMDCIAAIPVSVAGIKSAFGVTIKDNCNLGNISAKVYTKDRYVKGVLVYEGDKSPFCNNWVRNPQTELRNESIHGILGPNEHHQKEDICWEPVEYAVMNGMMIGLPVGKHLMVIDAFDGCYNSSSFYFVFEVKDKIAPIMKCDDDLHVTLSNANGYTNGYAQVSAADIDEGSWDNCKLSWIAVRRNVPEGCAASFIQKGYDTNGNGKLDALPADNDYSKADGFDRNGDGDIEDFGETFILKGGKLMTPLLDFVEFFCCDLTERVTVELWGGDIYGNTNYCWMDLLIEDKVAPTCLAPWDVTIYCDDKGLAQIDDKIASAKIFGDVIIPSGNDCAALDTVYSTEKKLKCGAGYIDRIWTLTKQTVKGPISITCKQRIIVLPVHEYNICFPKDVSTDCKTPIIDTVLTDELGCDILAVNVHDKRYDASDDECYKIFRTYSVINWCTYDDRCGDPLLQTNISIIDRAVFGNYGKAPIYVLVRDREDGVRDGIEEFYISKDLIHNNADDIRFKPAYCEVADEFYHSFIYTQIIKVYDDTRPVVTGTRDTFCTSPTACTANITKVVTLKDNCTDKVELETQFLMIAPFQTLDAGKMILYSTPRWSTKALADGQFEISVSNLPEGTHDLIVVGRDECGNLSLPTRIPFVVKDCKAPAPICINGLSVDLMPDGNGGGMMTVWASDFVASKIYDCNGQDASKGDPSGHPLITKYSVNRVQQPVDQNQTSISVNCADLELGFILVELHAWDNAGNHDFCVTYIEVQDNRKVCPTPADKVNIAGTISTEGTGNLQGVSVTLSGSGTQNDMTGTDGNYEFVNITKGGDFTVTPQLDKNHLNGVSTFDLVLIQKHILGVQALNSPYKMIAADANNSKSISTLDMIQIRKLILNIDTHFANNTSWRFVDATYRFPNATNPWSTSFPEVVSVNDLVTNVRANFVAIKVGDVNASASVNGVASAEIRTNDNFKLKTLEQNLKSGNEYRVAFTAEDLKNIQGYQFALNLDQSKAELLDIEYGVAKAENFGIFKSEGLITTSWNNKYEPGALFTLVLRAKADAKLSQSINLNRLVHPEAYDQHNENLGIALNFEGIQASEAYELRQNTPNPFSAETVIGFTLPKAMKGTLTVRDVKGALIYKVEGNYSKGNNLVTLKKEQLGPSGVLYYTLETSDFTATKKMIVLQ